MLRVGNCNVSTALQHGCPCNDINNGINYSNLDCLPAETIDELVCRIHIIPCNVYSN